MLADAWLKMVGALTPDDIRLLKAQECVTELFAFLDAFDKLAQAWRRTQPGAINKKTWAGVQVRLNQLRAALREDSL